MYHNMTNLQIINSKSLDDSEFGRRLRIWCSGQQIVGKRLFQPWYQRDFIWNLTSYPSELQSYKDYLAEFIDRILASEKLNSTGERTIVSRLMRVSEENPEFGAEDVKAEITTLLFGVTQRQTNYSVGFGL